METIMKRQHEFEQFEVKRGALEVYKPLLKSIKSLRIYGKEGSFCMGSYEETLFLLDHSNGCVFLITICKAWIFTLICS